MPTITHEESFLIQAHALAECLVKLGELERKQDSIFDDYGDRIFGQTAKILKNDQYCVFQGQGVILSVFYMFLVLPHEWSKNNVGNFVNMDISEAEKIANQSAIVINDDYCEKDIALRHFRNALAHGRISWNPSNGNLVISDKKKIKGGLEKHYSAEYSMPSLGEIVQSLNMSIAHYINDYIKK